LASVAALVTVGLLGLGVLLASILGLAVLVLSSIATGFLPKVTTVHLVEAAGKGASIAATVFFSLVLIRMMEKDGVFDDLVKNVHAMCKHEEESCLTGIAIAGAGAFEGLASFGTPATVVGPLLADAGVPKPRAGAAALTAHAPYGTLAAFGVPILVTAGILNQAPSGILEATIASIFPAYIVLPRAVAAVMDARVSKSAWITIVVATLVALAMAIEIGAPRIASPVVVLGTAIGLAWYLCHVSGEPHFKFHRKAVHGFVAYGVAVGLISASTLAHLGLPPWVALGLSTIVYAWPDLREIPPAIKEVTEEAWKELLSIVLLMVYGKLIAHTALPDLMRPFCRYTPIAFLVGYVGEMAVGSTTAVMATFASGTPFPGVTLAGAACAAAACPYNVAVAEAAVEYHGKKLARRALYGSAFLAAPTIAWVTLAGFLGVF